MSVAVSDLSRPLKGKGATRMWTFKIGDYSPLNMADYGDPARESIRRNYHTVTGKHIDHLSDTELASLVTIDPEDNTVCMPIVPQAKE